MAELKSMPWDERVWKALKAAITPMPPFVRGKALKKIIAASEENSRRRDSEAVEAQDLIKAARENVRPAMLQVLLQSLAEHGVSEHL